MNSAAVSILPALTTSAPAFYSTPEFPMHSATALDAGADTIISSPSEAFFAAKGVLDDDADELEDEDDDLEDDDELEDDDLEDDEDEDELEDEDDLEDDEEEDYEDDIDLDDDDDEDEEEEDDD